MGSNPILCASLEELITGYGDEFFFLQKRTLSEKISAYPEKQFVIHVAVTDTRIEEQI